MAIHVYNALGELAENNGTMPIAHLRSALNLSCWSEDLEFYDYCELSTLVDHAEQKGGTITGEIIAWAKTKRMAYMVEWTKLGMPTCREEWRNKKWGMNNEK